MNSSDVGISLLVFISIVTLLGIISTLISILIEPEDGIIIRPTVKTIKSEPTYDVIILPDDYDSPT